MDRVENLKALPHITADDSSFCWWLCDAQFVDTAIPRQRARDLVFDSREISVIDVLTARLRTHGISN